MPRWYRSPRGDTRFLVTTSGENLTPHQYLQQRLPWSWVSPGSPFGERVPAVGGFATGPRSVELPQPAPTQRISALEVRACRGEGPVPRHLTQPPELVDFTARSSAALCAGTLN